MTSTKPTVAVIGCGYWGKNLVRNMAELGALAAVCDANRPNAVAMATQYAVPMRSLAEIFADKSILGAVIAAPATQHAELATQALEAGKHVFVEKPLALSVKKAQEIQKLAAAKKKAVMVGHLLQYHPAYLRLKELVNKGEFGSLVSIASSRLNLGKLRTEENVLWSFAPHDISMILGLFGEAPTEITAQGTTSLTPGLPDIVNATLRFSTGATANLFVSWLHPVKEQKFTVTGQKAMAVFDDSQPWESKLTIYRHKIEWNGKQPVPLKAEAEKLALTPSEPLKNECQHFLDAMQGKPVRTDAAEGIRVLSVLEAAERSMATGKTVKSGAGELPADVFVHETAVVDQGCKLGTGTKIWHFSHILSGTKIGKDCIIGQNVMIGPDVVVGDRCKIQNNVSLYKGVTLEDGVFCGPSCVFTNVNTPRAEIERKSEYLATRVGHAATIGANATIVCGNDLGAYCFIGAGAVVTKTVKPHALMVGNPAKQIGWVSHAGERLGNDLICPREGRRYKVSKQGKLEEIQEEKRNVSPAKSSKKTHAA